MTLKIEVTIPEDEIRGNAASLYLKRAMAAIGFERPDENAFPREDVQPRELQPRDLARDLSSVCTTEDAAQPNDFTPEAAKRERGKPSPGKARRTKEEIAEDEAADATDAAAAPVEEPKPAISTGEERIDPTNPEDAAQDAADEAAEAEATKPAELTHDDVREVLRSYQKAYGELAVMQDGPKVIELMFQGVAAPAKPESGWKVSDIPSDQASLAKAVAGAKEMLEKNPFKRAVNL